MRARALERSAPLPPLRLLMVTSRLPLTLLPSFLLTVLLYLAGPCVSAVAATPAARGPAVKEVNDTGSAAVVTAGKLEGEEMMTLASGRQVPLDEVTKRMIGGTASREEVLGRLYEVKSGRFLHGPTDSVDLHVVTGAPRRQRSHVPAAVTVNGRVVARAKKGAVGKDDDDDDAAEDAVFVRQGRHAVVAAAADGVALAVWIDGRHLVPLDIARHPGVLLASTTHVDSQGVDMRHGNLSKSTFNASLDSIHRIATHRQQQQQQQHYHHQLLLGAVGNRAVSPLRPSCRQRTPARVLEVAIAFDNIFCARYGNSHSLAVRAVRALLRRAEIPFRSTCMRLKLARVEAHCNDRRDPYARLQGLQSKGILNGLRDEWWRRRTTIRRDVTALLTGFTDGTDVAGAAYIGATCTTSFGYAWIELGNPYVLAHELGHSVNARHTTDGLMAASLPSQPVLSFSEVTQREIASFIDYGGDRSACIASARAAPQPWPEPRKPTRYCDSGFSSRQALGCTSAVAGSFRSPYGRVVVSVTQQYNRFDLRLAVTPTTSVRRRNSNDRYPYPHRNAEISSSVGAIYSYRRRLSMKPALARNALGSRYSLPRGASAVFSKWPAAILLLPLGKSTCCRARLYIYVDIRVCNRKGACASGFGTFTVPVVCGNYCPGKQLVPMSTSHKCPSCL